MKIGFDNEKYLKIQSEHIKERIDQFGDKLYLEFGGKLFDDYHASRVLPGFAPDSKLQMLMQLSDMAEIVIVISATDIEKNKKRGDLGITYDVDVIRLISEYEKKLKLIEEDIASLNIEIAGINASINENKLKAKEIKESLIFSDMSDAEIRRNELTYTLNSIQQLYDIKEQERNQIHDEVTKLTSKIESLKKSLEGIEISDVTDKKAKKTELEYKRNDLIKKIQEERTRIRINNNVLENIKDKAESLKETEKNLSYITSLSKTANGDLAGKEKIKLETYIQTTYFDRIIRRANLRFMEMSSGQYELKRQRVASDIRGQSGLDLVVIDHYNGTERSVRTLSGGESFMASLSLALGLSEEVQSSSGGVSVDTLFVDEGFGTLDSDSLDLAYKALTNVTEGNRLVGIISHVAELRNKIDNQIIVKKEKSGGSVATVRV